MSHSAYNYSYSAPPYPPPQGHIHEASTSTVIGGGPDPKDVEEARGLGRTPSPTPSEARELSRSGAIDWKSMMNWKFWIRKEWWSILFVISFPPLFGHEIVAILCGVVWGLGPGFAIVAAGTFIGEIGNFYAFKYLCHARSEKTERNSIFYACLAQVVREGGFKIALIARLSAIPGHFTTAIFATCGMGIFTFCIAAFLSLPKQLVTVYLGVLLEQSSEGTVDKKSKTISDLVVVLTTVITFVAMWYILRQVNHVKPDVIYKRRKARQAKLVRAQIYDSDTSLPNTNNGNVYTNPENAGIFNPQNSDSDIPLQQWDAQGRALGYAQDPNLYAPQPRRISGVPKIGQSAVRQSTEEVGWDLGSRGSSAALSPRIGASPRQQQQQRRQGLGVTRFSEELDQPTPTQATFPAGAGPSSPRTVMQPAFSGGPSSPRLNNPYGASFDPYGSTEEPQRAAVGPPGYGAGAGAATRPMSPARSPGPNSYTVPAYGTASPMGQGVSHRTSYHESDLR
ncbi:hypothetical protein BDQ17DRAFT_1424263 [Cyathus striatus]|nr:hypothetical protein BDQ17DRAFT_1424263 [Cyathus striatus]